MYYSTKNYENVKSIMATEPSERVSNRYKFISTLEPIRALETKGFVVVSAREARSKAKAGFQKHIVRFRKLTDLNRTLSIDELIPEVVLTNSHDGCSTFNFSAGLFRCVCSNQMTIADSTIASTRVYHKGYSDEKIIEATYQVIEETPKMLELVNEFRETKLDDQERMIYGQSALQLYYDEEKLKNINVEETLIQLLKPKRVADVDKNLWNTFNVVQEKMLKGARFQIDKIDENDPWDFGKTRKTRAVKSIDKDQKLNKALWSLTEKMLELKKAK